MVIDGSKLFIRKIISKLYTSFKMLMSGLLLRPGSYKDTQSIGFSTVRVQRNTPVAQTGLDV